MNYTQQTRDIDLMFNQCWFNIYDVGPTLVQQWVNFPCLLRKLKQIGLGIHLEKMRGGGAT